MSAPPSVRQIAREALKDAPGWVDGLLQPLNTFMRQVVDLFTGNLTVSENLAQAWVSVPVTEGVAVAPFPAGLNARTPKGVTLERVSAVSSGGTPGTPPTGAVTFLWEPTTVDGKPFVRVTSITGLAAGARYTLLFLVKAE